MSFDTRVPFVFETARRDDPSNADTSTQEFYLQPIGQVIDENIDDNLDSAVISGPADATFKASGGGNSEFEYCVTGVPEIIDGVTTTYQWSIKTALTGVSLKGSGDDLKKSCVTVVVADAGTTSAGKCTIQCIVTNSEADTSPVTVEFEINVKAA